MSKYQLPQPITSGSLDLSTIKPVNTGSVSIGDAIATARGQAIERGLTHGTGRVEGWPAGRTYVRSRSRSRSRTPPRRDGYRDSYSSYREETRDDRGRGGAGYGRDRSRSPERRGRGNLSPAPNRHGARERSPADDNSEIIVIDSALVGLVIGRQGENLRKVEQETKTKIQFVTGPDHAVTQRECRITGTTRARSDAKREINRIIDENGGNPVREMSSGRAGSGPKGSQAKSTTPVLREGDNNIQIMVPDRTVGLIIGRGGETIRDLQERSGCHVNIVGESKSVNGLRPVNLIGSQQAAARAKELILEIVDSDTRALTNQNPSKESFRSAATDGMDSSNSKLSESIRVPSEAVGMIIGKGTNNLLILF